MTGVIATIPKFQFSSSTGVPLALGTLTVYLAGTTTPTDTWQDSALSTLNTNPVQLDSSGSCVLWLDSTKSYKFVLKNAAGAIQWTQDNIAGADAHLRGDLAASSGSSLVGYLPAGTGAVASTVQTVLRESVSVTRFGATGDGTTDDTAAVQAAINSGYKFIYAPDGNYKITANLLITGNDITIFGPGVFLVSSADLYMFKISGNNNVLHRIKATNTGSYGNSSQSVFPKAAAVYISGSNNAVDGCQLENVVNGVIVYGNNGASQVYGNRVINNNISVLPFNYGAYMGWPNDGILSFYAVGTIITGNTVAVYTAPGAFVMSGTAYTYARGAIICDINSENNEVRGNSCGQGFLATLHNEAGSNNVLANNKCFAGYYSTIVGGSGRVEFNQVIAPAYNATASSSALNAGITMVGNGIVNANTITCSDSQVPAIQLQTNASNYRIQNNTVSGTFNYGVKGNYLSDLYIEGNTVSGTFTAAFNVSTAAPNTGRTFILGNSVSGTYANALTGSPVMSAVITGNSFNDATGNTISLSGDTNYVTVTGNDLSNRTLATLSGVQITGTAGQFSCSATTGLTVNQQITISGTFGGTGSISGYGGVPTQYYIIATNGTSTFTLSSTRGGAAITTTAGTPTGLTYSLSTNTYGVYLGLNGFSRWAVISGNNLTGHSTGVGIAFSEYTTHQIVSGNINGTTDAL